MQRSRLRRNQRVKSLRGRVVSIKDEAQWDRLLEKHADRLVVAHFYAVRLSWASEIARSFKSSAGVHQLCSSAV
jgi:hypothetical protein